MVASVRHGIGSATAALLLVLGLVGCVDEKVVFQDRELFEELPQGAANFVGYTDAEEKLTVCGNCHVGQQSGWEETAHADAFVTLEASGHAQAFCEGCHTVNPLGNPAEGEGGWLAVTDDRYKDVQCESCHGPGLAHVQNPDGGTEPQAPMTVGLDLTQGCGECHQGTHHPFVEEWEQSKHGQVNAYPAGRAGCKECHTGEDALQAWGVKANYLNKEELLASNTDHLPIACAVCHDPHSSEFEGQLRFPIDVASEEQNLCMKCHHKRGTPDPTTFRGPHSPEGPVLLGYGGWFPPNMEFIGNSEIVATHGSEANPRLCAGCHVQSYEITDAATGEFVLNTTGHLFQAIPCLDAQGVPTTDQSCGISERSFRSCTASGCHGSENAARSAMITVEQRILSLTETLKGLIAQIPKSEFSPSDNRYTTGEGAQFNLELALYPGSGVHNPFLIESLLTASIRQVRQDYNLNVSPDVVLDNILQKH